MENNLILSIYFPGMLKLVSVNRGTKMDQPDSPKTPDPEPATLDKPQNEKEAIELTEEDLESITGGTGTASPTLFHSTANGKHFDKATINVR